MIDQSFLSLFITFSMIELTNRGSGIIDGLFVSNFLDTESIAAVGIAKTIFSFIGIVSGFFTVGTLSMCSQELGKGSIKGFNRIFSAMFYVAIGVASVATLALMFGAEGLAMLMGATGNGARLVGGAAQYLRGVGIGIIPLILTPMLSSACQLDSAKKRVRRSGIVYFVANCSFDYLAVRLGMGVFGIGLATALGMYCQFGYVLLHFRTKDRMLRFTKFDMGVKEIFATLARGTERALRSLGNFVSPAIVNRIILLYGGTLAMSAFSIQRDLVAFVEIFASGLADATALQSGVFYGEMNSEAVNSTGRSAHRINAMFLGASLIVLTLFSRFVAGIYISEPGELFEMVVFASIMTGFYAPINGLVRSRLSYLNAVKRTRNMQIMTFLSTVVYTIISALTLGSLFGAYGVLSSELMRVTLLLITVWVFYCVKTKKLFPRPDDYLSLPENFDPYPGDVISVDVRDEEDISMTAEQIQLFCNGHKVDKRVGYKAAVCFEELCVNIIRFGFPKCKKKPGIDLRLIIKDNKLVMRLRDNCPMFDVERYIAQEIEASESPDEIRIGLKMISGLTEDISYVHLLDNNNVILRFPLSAE
jgi:Na+-driven multidrug efflux pump/anti-sigma regulatory factor (Ser/Thr protein kinase)